MGQIWRKSVLNVELAQGRTLGLIVAGLDDDKYISRVQTLNWAELYENQGLAQSLEDWRTSGRSTMISS